MTEKKDHATSLLILTGEESRIVREALEWCVSRISPLALSAFNRGMARGTERVAAEFAEKQKAKRKEKP